MYSDRVHTETLGQPFLWSYLHQQIKRAMTLRNITQYCNDFIILDDF